MNTQRQRPKSRRLILRVVEAEDNRKMSVEGSITIKMKKWKSGREEVSKEYS